MSKRDRTLASLPDPRARAVLDRLHAEADREMPKLVWQYLPHLHKMLLGRKLPWERLERLHDDKYIPLGPAEGVFCYLLARAIGARRIVEFGTSYGISTIYLALAVRENGGGLVIGTEMVPGKVARAREHLREAGLSELVEIREGKALETLRDLEGPVDFLLNDGFPPYALDVLELVAPRMRAGAVVFTDNVGMFKGDHVEYLAYLRDPSHGFHSASLALSEVCELSVRVPAANGEGL
jgi:predicted O-methyltransferase YrrM